MDRVPRKKSRVAYKSRVAIVSICTTLFVSFIAAFAVGPHNGVVTTHTTYKNSGETEGRSESDRESEEETNYSQQSWPAQSVTQPAPVQRVTKVSSHGS